MVPEISCYTISFMIHNLFNYDIPATGIKF